MHLKVRQTKRKTEVRKSAGDRGSFGRARGKHLPRLDILPQRPNQKLANRQKRERHVPRKSYTEKNNVKINNKKVEKDSGVRQKVKSWGRGAAQFEAPGCLRTGKMD